MSWPDESITNVRPQSCPHPEFRARVAEIAREVCEAALKYPIRQRVQRIAELQKQWTRLERVIVERAADPAMAEVPGGQTGLMAHTVRRVGVGNAAREVEVVQVDATLLREMREVLAAAASEMAPYEAKAATDPQPTAALPACELATQVNADVVGQPGVAP